MSGTELFEALANDLHEHITDAEVTEDMLMSLFALGETAMCEIKRGGTGDWLIKITLHNGVMVEYSLRLVFVRKSVEVRS